MNVLITSPSLDMTKNVNGISAVVAVIVSNSRQTFFHYRFGRPDAPESTLRRLGGLMAELSGFPLALLRNRVDLVHQNFPFNARGVLREALVTAMSTALRIPVMLHVHGGEYLMKGCSNRFLRHLALFMLRRSRAVVVLSQVEREALSKNFGIHDADVLSNAVEIPKVLRTSSTRLSSKRTVLFLGRVHESKGVEDLVEAFRQLYAKKPFHFIACGAGPLQGYLVDSCREFMGRDFEFRGVVSGEEKEAIIASSDIFVLPSRYGEGLPMALLEAMAGGLVPVVTDDASMKIVVKPHLNGLRVQKRDPSDLAAKIESLLTQDELLGRLSAEAVKTVRQDFSIDRYVASLETIYRRCIQREFTRCA